MPFKTMLSSHIFILNKTALQIDEARAEVEILKKIQDESITISMSLKNIRREVSSWNFKDNVVNYYQTVKLLSAQYENGLKEKECCNIIKTKLCVALSYIESIIDNLVKSPPKSVLVFIKLRNHIRHITSIIKSIDSVVIDNSLLATIATRCYIKCVNNNNSTDFDRTAEVLNSLLKELV